MKSLTRFDIALLFLLALVIVIVGSIMVNQSGANVSELLYSGLFIFSIQGIINLFLNRNIESFKNEINKEAEKNTHSLNLSLESFRSDLSLTLVKQSKLHENRLGIISELYGKIVTLHQKMAKMTQLFQRVPDGENAEELKDKDIQASADAFNDFLDFYLRNKIYLSPETSEKIDEIRNQYKSVFWDFTIDRQTGLPISEALAERIAGTYKTMEEVIPPILNQIEDDFRTLLGVN